MKALAAFLAMEDVRSNLDLLLRWIHVIAGITWIGLLYFFNWINSNFQTVLEKEHKKAVNPKLLPRVLFFFRWGAMVTFLAGLALFTYIYMYQDGKGFGPSSLFSDPVKGGLTARAIWILIGMGLASVMWFNVWFIIWPAQKKIIPAVRDGQAPDAALVKRATLASKINTYFSAPMLFCMLGAAHYGAINLATIIIVAVIALATIFVIYKGAPKVPSM